MRLLLLQGVKMLIDEVMMDSFYTAYQYPTLHNVSCLKNNFDYDKTPI